MAIKRYRPESVLAAARSRISLALDECEKAYVSFSGGKDSTVLLHLVMDEAIRRGRKIGVLIVDLEAQYMETAQHMERVVEMYRDHIDLHWIALPLNLRNAVTNYQPQWQAWDPDNRDIWVRTPPPYAITDPDFYPWFQRGMEFEELIELFADWYGGGTRTAAFIGIRAQESLHRYLTVAGWDKTNVMLNKWRWTTRVANEVYNTYPIYDWQSEDIWRYHSAFPDKPHNSIYDKMQMAGVPLSQQRLCQPYGDDQRKGLWLYHILEPETWPKLLARVNGANAGALYVGESGNVMGYNKITLPPGHTWKSFTNLMLMSLPKPTRDHFVVNFKRFIVGWKRRGYDTIPDEAPPELEANSWAPSWRRMCKCLLRNDWWCKGLGFSQPKSAAWLKYKALKARKLDEAPEQMAMEINIGENI
jgi:predicted phosphoadenosine phosphosulfate sulfurtransferase